MVLLALLFIFGYAAIALEHPLKTNKSAIALIMATLSWVVIGVTSHSLTETESALMHHLSASAEILFFLLGAMTIVEVIDAHNGFDVITRYIKTKNITTLFWLIGIFTFFLSAILDNLTTTIVFISLLRKLVKNKQNLLLFSAVIVIAANAGGAWSVIGDVTTTMLWIKGKISPLNIIVKTFFPALICYIIPSFWLSKSLMKETIEVTSPTEKPNWRSNFILSLGFGLLLFIPVFKYLTHLPPYLGMLGCLGLLWVVSEWIHLRKPENERSKYSAASALTKIDTPSMLFFLGILLTIGALEHVHILEITSNWLSQILPNTNATIISLGLLSAIVDNVPLVAGAIAMYNPIEFPLDHEIWEFLALSAGTGGSILIIGSAAGVAAMGMMQINFMWYLKKVAFPAFIGFIVGCFTYIFWDMLF